MFIEVRQKYECSNCGASDVESFADARYQGLRCKKCGHEKKDLHPHLKAQEAGGTSYSGTSKVQKF
jgi:DNA-directed RNA polymerase subunit RPC12/RpoP